MADILYQFVQLTNLAKSTNQNHTFLADIWAHSVVNCYWFYLAVNVLRAIDALFHFVQQFLYGPGENNRVVVAKNAIESSTKHR